MGTIVARGEKWRAVVRKKGITKTKTFSKIALARRWVIATEHALESSDLIGRGVSLGSLLKKYREQFIEKVPYRLKAKFHLKRFEGEWANVTLAEMTPEWWVSSFQKINVSPGSRTRYLTIVTSALSKAEALWGANVDWQSYRRGKSMLHAMGLTGLAGRRTRRVSDAEIASIKAACVGQLPMADIIDFAVLTALRSAEITRVTFEDYEPGPKMLLVRDRKHPRRKLGNHSRIPLLGGAAGILERQPSGTGRVFPYHHEVVQRVFRAAAVKAGVRDVHFHDLRHEAVSRLFEQGYSIQEVSLLSGHQDWSSLKVYTQLSAESLHAGPLAKMP